MYNVHGYIYGSSIQWGRELAWQVWGGPLKRKHSSNIKKVVSSANRYTGYTLAHNVQLQENKGISMERMSCPERAEQEPKSKRSAVNTRRSCPPYRELWCQGNGNREQTLGKELEHHCETVSSVILSSYFWVEYPCALVMWFPLPKYTELNIRKMKTF